MNDIFKSTLQKYLDDHENPIGSISVLPHRIPNSIIHKEDLEGECLDISLNHLKASSFPYILACAISHEVTQLIIDQDLSVALTNNNPERNSYESVKIAPIVFAQVHSLCKEWIKNIPFSVKSQPKPSKHSQFGIKNTRRKMEDRHSVFPNLNVLLGLTSYPTIQWYAVYDGHGGLDASNYVSKQLHLNFTKEVDFLSDVEQSLKSCILKTDEKFCSKSRTERLRSGTTVVVAVIVEQMLHIAWVGDSQALLVKDGKPITLMNPHKPDRPDEKQRIEDMGGCVVWFGAWRVNGTLSVSRAIGDADHKPFICGDADTYNIPLDGNEDFLCLACDGFWDVFTGEDLIRLVREYLKENNDHESVSEYLCLKAKSEGSSDNITVVVVFLRDEIDMGEVVSEEANLRNDVNEKYQHTSTNISDKVNKTRTNEEASSDPYFDSLRMIQGQQLELEQKQKIPHKLLFNYIRNINQKKIDKSAIIVKESSPHAKLPNSLRNPKLENHSHPALPRKDTRDHLLKLAATVESLTELPHQIPKCKREIVDCSSELPSINNTDKPSKDTLRRSTTTLFYSVEVSRKPLGYRAPNMLARGRPRKLYRTTIVGSHHQGNFRPPARCRGYARSLPDDVLIYDENGRTEIAITNSLTPSLKPRQHAAQKNRHIVKFVNRSQRSRSRSLF